MAESYLKDQKRVLPCAVHVNGAYDIKDLYVGLPCVIGEKGVERIVELALTDAEKAALNKSADAVRGLIDVCKSLEPKLG
jgi:malate dehydrogenase